MSKIKYIICFLFLVNIGFSQVNTTITGTIYSEGIKLVKAKVAVLGTDNYVFTDSIGQYKINALEGNVLEFSYKGKTSTTFTVSAMKLINVTLKDENAPIEKEITILHTRMLRKKKPENSDYETGWKINPKQTISTNNNALFVVNGNILDKAVMDKIPNQNIESLDVLKDENSIAKFGHNGRNGAVLIQTKDISEVDLKNLYTLYPYTTELNSNQKTKTVSGVISDCENIPLSDILVQNINSKKSVFTDSLGKFTIEVRKNDILSFTNQSYQSQRIQYIKQKKIVVSLKANPISDKIMVKKPVIYLYPKEKTDIELKINFEGKLLTTFPKLDKSWKVTAYENGQIFDKKTNRFYNSLFWDGAISFPASHYQYKTGFVVEKEKLTSFLIEKLEFMGLNTTETNDFIQYWLPILEQNEYTFMHFLVNEDYNVFSTNNVNPKPDTSIRIFMEFFGADEKLSILPQKLPSTVRTGFTLVEWGGSDVSNAIDIYKLLENKNISKYVYLDKKPIEDESKFIYTLNHKKISKKTFDKLKFNDILKIEVFDSKKGGALYGEDGRNGVISVTTKNNKNQF